MRLFTSGRLPPQFFGSPPHRLPLHFDTHARHQCADSQRQSRPRLPASPRPVWTVHVENDIKYIRINY